VTSSSDSSSSDSTIPTCCRCATRRLDGACSPPSSSYDIL
jgi:hypothetical protein